MNSLRTRTLAFSVCSAAAIALVWVPVREIIGKGYPAEYYTHIPLVPIVSAFVLIRRWKHLFRGDIRPSLWGGLLISLGVGMIAADTHLQPDLVGHIELVVIGAILSLAGCFIGLFGWKAFRRALFPFLFLIFMVPLPLTWMDRIVEALVALSTDFTNLLLRAFGVPFVQEGAMFSLPGFDIKVARECSGIRSSLALLITTVLAGQLFLFKRWKKVALILAVLPVTVLKNAVRIVTLYLLSYFVDMRIIEGGFLHRSGGFVFFGLGLAMLAFMLWILRSPREAWRKAMAPPFLPE